MIKQLAAALTVIAAFSAAPCFAGETVSIQLTNGSQLQGDIHSETNGDYLWLRATNGSTTVIRPIAWNDIATAQHGDQQLTSMELQQAAPQWKQQPAPKHVIPAAPHNGLTYAERALIALGFAAK